MKKLWTNEELKYAKQLYNEGLTFNEIAQKILRTKKAVKLKLYKFGLKSNKPIFNEDVICINCGIKFQAPKREHRKFCCKSCAAKYNNLRKPYKIKNDSEENVIRRNRYHKRKENKCLWCGKPVYDKFCNHNCQKEYKLFHETMPRFEKGLISDRGTLRKLLKEIRGEKCELCNLTEWRSLPLSFIVDHKNGDSTNNLPDNLQLICPNCDSQSPHFAGRNHGNGRKSRGIKRYELSQDPAVKIKII